MKRRDLLSQIATAAKDQGIPFVLHREGGNHSIFRLGELLVTVPRHREIVPNTATAILRQCAPELGKDWWK